ncbi:TolC family protein [Chitinophaga agri]|uniref:TolC family protein n=1 Tax=Chitinophaga agri TaxID=2703787 RepID=A0A6B9Z7I5_9BACT|nr:TolC family protein [Chitinophaga agri]QHS58192.1 TolC family protein [Chitinophaga agri]
MKCITSILILFITVSDPSYAQESLGNHPLTLPAAFALAMRNNTDISVARHESNLARQEATVSRLGHLPDASAGLTEGYLSNADIWEPPGLGDHRTLHIPHQMTALSVEASEVIYAGGRVNANVRKADLKEQIALLALEEKQQDILLLIAARYLEIYRQLNHREVYLNNSRLARERMHNIMALRKQGMVTKNDSLRTQIQISDYDLAARRVGNAIIRLNNSFNVALALPDSMRLIPDSSLLHTPRHTEGLDYYLALAQGNSPSLRIGDLETAVSHVQINEIKAERLPVLSAYAGSGFQRPFLNAAPPQDIYYNIWQAGIRLHYNINSLYKTPQKIRAGELAQTVAQSRARLREEEVDVSVRNAYNRYQESWDVLETSKRDVESANENYRIVMEKYQNQLALITDVIDASNTKIDTEIKVTDALIDTIYTYYQLLKSAGKL